MSTLERIEVRGFKSIREMDLKLGSLNILIGANGALTVDRPGDRA
jgi:predicted ATPase